MNSADHRFDFGEIDPVELEDRATRERQLKHYSNEALLKAAQVEQVYVLFPQFGTCLAACDRAFQLSRALNTPQGILITGAPGTSKTTIAKYFISSLPQSDLFEKGFGALLIRLRNSPTTTHVVSALLRALRYPFANVRRSNVHAMRDLSFESIRQRGTRLIFFDQAHCLNHNPVRSKKDVDETTVSDLLSEMMDETGASLCLLADSQFQGLDAVDRALADRVTTREVLEHFKKDEIWVAFLNAFARQTKAIDLSCLSTPEIQARTYGATHGNRRQLRRLLIEATLVAADAKSSAVDRSHLSTAFSRVTGTGNQTANPYD